VDADHVKASVRSRNKCYGCNFYYYNDENIPIPFHVNMQSHPQKPGEPVIKKRQSTTKIDIM